METRQSGKIAPQPLSNAEVKQMLMHRHSEAKNNTFTNHINEQGHILRAAAEEYLFRFNEFENAD